MSAFWGRAARGISATTEAWLEEASRRARDLHPERFAPDGTALIEYAGTSWAERLASWTRAQSGRPASTDATAGVPASEVMAEAERFASNARFAEEQSRTPGPEASHWYGYARGLAEAGRSMLDVLKVTAPAHGTVPASAVRPGEGRPWATVPSQQKTTPE